MQFSDFLFPENQFLDTLATLFAESYRLDL